MNVSGTSVAAVLTVGVLLTACGSGHPHNAAAPVTQLRQDMDAVAAAAARHDYSAASNALTALNADPAVAHANGTLTADQLNAIRAAIANVQTDLTVASTTPPVTVTVSPPPPATSGAVPLPQRTAQDRRRARTRTGRRRRGWRWLNAAPPTR